jgi:hypothetical protein
MLNYNIQFEIELKKLINLEIERLTDNICGGAGVVDYADYKHQIGKVAGLRMVLDLCEEAQSILAKR